MRISLSGFISFTFSELIPLSVSSKHFTEFDRGVSGVAIVFFENWNLSMLWLLGVGMSISSNGRLLPAWLNWDFCKYSLWLRTSDPVLFRTSDPVLVLEESNFSTKDDYLESAESKFEGLGAGDWVQLPGVTRVSLKCEQVLVFFKMPLKFEGFSNVDFSFFDVENSLGIGVKFLVDPPSSSGSSIMIGF
jgi:hypothetical protein